MGEDLYKPFKGWQEGLKGCHVVMAWPVRVDYPNQFGEEDEKGWFFGEVLVAFFCLLRQWAGVLKKVSAHSVISYKQ
ncbi:MAG: hypothetical protein U9O82_09610 [Thermodesulfobacteriota bacterium]|nr:hypothetical protein [Thermodesulfobacteriota bacterium]